MSAAPTPPSRTFAAAGAVLVFAVVIGFTDNFVRVIAQDTGLWQFHAVRTLMILALVLALLRPLGLRLRPLRLGPVAARSSLHGLAMLIYFGCLAFLPVPQVVAGLFTAPIFVLVISRLAYGEPIGPFRVIAVGVGFMGVLLVLGPGGQAPLSLASVLPVVAGLFYAIGNIATRKWCEGESTETLTLGFFVALGIAGAIGLLVLTVMPQAVPEGPTGFIQRGWVPLSGNFLFWTFVQAVGSLLAVGMLVKGYQLAEASRVAVFEYMLLPFAAAWGWLIWDEAPGLRAAIGMVLIVAAGLTIAVRAAPANSGTAP